MNVKDETDIKNWFKARGGRRYVGGTRWTNMN